MSSTEEPADRREPGLSLVVDHDSLKALRIADFLPVADRDALFDAACAGSDAFRAPGAAAGTETRHLETGCGQAGGAIQRAAARLGERIREFLPGLFTALDVEPFPVREIPLTLIHGLGGHRALPHVDSLDKRFAISLLYYFHRLPKAFRGGDLQLFEADPDASAGHAQAPLATLEPVDNLLLAFPSETFHAVTEVECASGEFADGRFVAVGFLGP